MQVQKDCTILPTIAYDACYRVPATTERDVHSTAFTHQHAHIILIRAGGSNCLKILWLCQTEHVSPQNPHITLSVELHAYMV